MTTKEIVKEYLEKNGFDGLLNQDGQCACLSTDLFTCENNPDECQPGYYAGCPPTCNEHDWHITLEKNARI